MQFVDKKHNGGRRQFIHGSRTWYFSASNIRSVKDYVTIGIYHYTKDGQDDGTTGEFNIDWIELAGKHTPKLVMFDDAWGLFNEFSDLWPKLAELDGTDPSPDQICKLLLELGIEDATKEEME